MLLQARVTKEKAVDTLTNEGAEPVVPKLDFEPIQPNGAFGMHFNSAMAGPSIMGQLDVVVSSKGTVSDLFADETRAPGAP